MARHKPRARLISRPRVQLGNAKRLKGVVRRPATR